MKGFLQGHKTDANDALAIANASLQIGLKTSKPKSEEQQTLQTLDTIILFGYSRGLVSSRRIATNITFMSLSGDEQSHYTSIASFVSRMKEKIEPLFTQVLMICDREGLIGRNMFAIDGYKIK